jgi:hypothetical protein
MSEDRYLRHLTVRWADYQFGIAPRVLKIMDQVFLRPLLEIPSYELAGLGRTA